MIDNVTIVTKGGLVLWSHTTHPLTGNPVNALIRNVLLESRSSEKSYNYDKYVLKWSLENDLDLLFIITYQKMIPLLYVDELLALVKQQFLNNFKDVLSGAKKSSSSSSSSLSQQSSINSSNGSSTTQTLSHYNFSEFTEEYKNILRAVEMRDRENRALKKQGAFQKQTVSERLRSEKQIQKEKEKKLARDQRRRTNNNNSEEEENSDEDNDSDNSNSDSESPTTPTHQQTNNRDSLDAQSLSPSVRRSGSKREMKTFSKKDSPATGGNSSGSKPVKKATKWDDMKYTKAAADALNANKKNTSSEDDQVNAFMNRYMPDRNARTNIDDDDDDESSFNANDYKLQEKEEKKTGIFGSFFNNLANGKTIEKEELVPLMQKFKESLISKNVAAEIAEKICESVAEDLQGKKISAFTRLQSEVIRSLEETMTRILTPKRNIDMLRDIMAAREQNRPYVITFCGVNGVGKSTSLSKICFWLLQNNLKCLIAACDTFRSGAVEQLNVHAKCLNVPVYDRGYGKDISIVAKEAINEAKRKNYDVVLVDTAGRMQDNEPLMKSLTKLIYLNNPDMVLFVGEALVGNDGIDQLMKFNDALKNISMGENAAAAPARDLIDGIVLTKFDTIDDKVGAAISMVYKTGHPIVFVGVGQTYTDLKKLSIKSVVRSLLN